MNICPPVVLKCLPQLEVSAHERCQLSLTGVCLRQLPTNDLKRCVHLKLKSAFKGDNGW